MKEPQCVAFGQDEQRDRVDLIGALSPPKPHLKLIFRYGFLALGSRDAVIYSAAAAAANCGPSDRGEVGSDRPSAGGLRLNAEVAF